MYRPDRMAPDELRKYVGTMDQMMGAREFRFSGGRQDLIPGIEVYDDTGLSFVVLPDRGLDIGPAFYRGRSIAMLCKNGIVGSRHFESGEGGFFRSFNGGLLATCGLRNVGEPVTDGGETFGLHDRISNLPAEDVRVEKGWGDKGYEVRVSGSIRESTLYGPNLVLKREIVCRMGEAKIHVRDKIVNEGFSDAEFMFMYHMNFGYPLISPAASITSPAEGLRALTESARGHEAEYGKITAPDAGYAYQCIEHIMPRDRDIQVLVANREVGFGACVRYSSAELPCFDVWKMLGAQDYVVALEPGLNLPEGRLAARQAGRLSVLPAGGSFRCGLEIGILDPMLHGGC